MNCVDCLNSFKTFPLGGGLVIELLGQLTKKCVANIFGYLVARFRLREMAEFLVEHSFELEKRRCCDEN